jgi:vacuolar-type H+-ATPase subunit D/Vma8
MKRNRKREKLFNKLMKANKEIQENRTDLKGTLKRGLRFLKIAKEYMAELDRECIEAHSREGSD